MQKDRKVLIRWFAVFIAIAHIANAETKQLTTTGIVVDNQSRPLEGVEIMIVPGRCKAVLSDSQGQFKITWSPHSWQDEDTVSYVVARHKVKNFGIALPIDNNAGTLKLALEPGVSLSGRVVDTEGKAISSDRLSITLYASNWGSTIDSQSETDRNGVFKFNALPVDNRYKFTAKAEGYGQKSIYFDAKDAVNGHLDLGRIELASANMSVSGQVVDINGHLVPGIDIGCIGEGQPSCRTKSDEQGHFTLDGVCAGLVRFMVERRIGNELVSCQILTEAGARDIKIVVTERSSRSRSRYIRTKSHEEIIKDGNLYVAGRIVDENGVAVADVPVNVRCMQSKNKEGQDTESYFNAARFGDVTDTKGHFAIELQEKATYSLLFSPNNHAAVIVYDVVTGTRDLKVILPNGGTITGQLVRFSRGKKVPLPNAKVELKQTSRISYSHIGFDRDRKMMTDSQGRFRFEHIRTLMRTDRKQPVFIPRVWELSYGETSQTLMFLPDETVKHTDLLIRPNISKAPSRIGKALPDFIGINIDLSQERFRDSKLLICFFDYQQRPARHCILQLNDRFGQLHEQDLQIIAVQTSNTVENELEQWIKKMNISIPVGVITGDDIDNIRFNWNVQSLPWLILTDKKHIVRAEGFALSELDTKIKEVAP